MPTLAKGDRMYRGFLCHQNRGYYRGEWGRWEIWLPSSFPHAAQMMDCTTFNECQYRIDRMPDAAPLAPKRTRTVTKVRTPRMVHDAGRAACGFTNETNDCTVRAIANTRCISYAAAHALAAKIFGRKDRHGTVYTRQRLSPQSWCRNLNIKGGTLDAFVLAHPVGHFLVLQSRHCVAVCDGVVHDGHRTSGLSRIESVFEVFA